MKEGENYKTQPVISSHLGMAYKMNNLISEVLELIAKNMPGRAESSSTNTLLSRVDKLNKKLVEL